MKRIFTFVLSTLLCTQLSFAQHCPLPNGDFENWTDLTADFEYYGDLPDGTVILPEGYIGFIRIFFSALDELFEVLTGEELINLTESYFGISQTTDATSGDFAVQIGGDEFAPFADLIGIFPCNGELPAAVNFDVKHVGNCTDSLSVVGIFNSTPDLPQDESSLEDVRAYFNFGPLISDTDTDYQTVGLPIVDNNNGISPDSILVFVFVSGTQSCLEEGNESAFRIDNFSFSPTEVLSMAGISNLFAEFINDHNYISWRDYENSNIDHFIIERSFGNTDEFVEIEKVESEYNQLDYNYGDYDISETGSYFYRIQGVDIQGNQVSSDIIRVDVEFQYDYGLELFPNPVEDKFQIELSLSSPETQLEYQIFGFDGRLVTQRTDLGSSFDKGKHTFDINVEDLNSGNYSVRVNMGSGKSIMKRFVIN